MSTSPHSGSGPDSRGTKRSRQACLNCRRKKAKCHGEQPVCSYCARLGQTCIYPTRSPAGTSTASLSARDSAPLPSSNYHDLVTRISLLESRLNNIETSPGSAPSTLLNANVSDLRSLLGWQSSMSGVHQVLRPTANNPPVHNQDVNEYLCQRTTLPPPSVLSGTVDLYFHFCHLQPYCFFHEVTFRDQLLKKILPEYLVFAVLAIAVRFSNDPFYENQQQQFASKYAYRAWNDILHQCFEGGGGPDYRLVQAATLLALHDFTACKHGAAWIKIGLAVSMAQASRMITEPPHMLSWSAQEERRRTLWSIYLLDKMGTCGRGRPSLFLDQTCQLQLPCSEISFQISSYQKTATLEDFKGLDEVQIEHSGPFARTIAIASTLSQVAAYAFQQNKTSNQKAPWDHNSEFQMICSQLIRFETSFDSLQSLQALIQGDVPPAQDNSTQPTEMLVFSYILYNLCYCLLQHPFLLRRQWETSGARVPVSFSARALESCSRHAQELTQTLANANRAGYRVSASFFSYCSLVAGTVHCLFQHSVSEEMRAKSEEALRDSLAHLEEKAKYWPNAGRMAGALEHFSHDAAKYVLLLDPSLQYVPLDSADVERLYTLCDYGAMSTDRIPDDIFNTSTNASTASDFFLNVDFVEPVTTVGIRDFGSNIPSTEQEYGHHDIDRTTQLEDPSSSLDTSERTVSMAPDHIWSYT